MKAVIHFNADSSVGIFPYSYQMEIPDFEEEYRQDTRERIKALYTELDGEFIPNVYFEDEKFD